MPTALRAAIAPLMVVLKWSAERAGHLLGDVGPATGCSRLGSCASTKLAAANATIRIGTRDSTLKYVIAAA